MICELRFCVYNKKNECRLETICINHLGMCGKVIIDTSENETDKERENYLKRWVGSRGDRH